MHKERKLEGGPRNGKTARKWARSQENFHPNHQPAPKKKELQKNRQWT